MVESLLMSQALLAAAIGVLYEYLRVVWAPGSKNIICIFEMSCFQSFLWTKIAYFHSSISMFSGKVKIKIKNYDYNWLAASEFICVGSCGWYELPAS